MTPPMMPGAGGMPAPYVITQKVLAEDVSPSGRYIGHVEPVHSVDLKPKVTGEIIKVMFESGSLVQKGDVLFEIEPDKYIAAVKLREAEVIQSGAVLKQAKKDYDRQVSLNKQKYVSESVLEASESKYHQAQATLKQAQANLDVAKLDLKYTKIISPITGKISKPLITEGNIVNATTQSLARIVQSDPVRVAFSITDKDFIKYTRLELSSSNLLKTELVLADGTVVTDQSFSRFTDNEVKTSTATVSIFSEYENKDNLLMPGSYVKVFIKENKNQLSVLIPQVSIAQDEVGAYAFVVNADNIAEERRLELGDIVGDKQVVISGVKAGEHIIIQGLQKVRNGATVQAALVANQEESK